MHLWSLILTRLHPRSLSAGLWNTCKQSERIPSLEPERELHASLRETSEHKCHRWAIQISCPWPSGCNLHCISSPLTLRTLHGGLLNHAFHFKRGGNWGIEVTHPQTRAVRKGVLIPVNSLQQTAQDLPRKMSSECQVLIQPCWHFCSYSSLNPSARSLSLLPAQPGVGHLEKKDIFLWGGVKRQEENNKILLRLGLFSLSLFSQNDFFSSVSSFWRSQSSWEYSQVNQYRMKCHLQGWGGYGRAQLSARGKAGNSGVWEG